EQPEVQRQAEEAGERRGDDDVVVPAEIGVHRGGEQPELQHHQHQDDGEDPGDDGAALAAGEAPGPGHDGLTSTPVAYTTPPRTSRVMRGSGRSGGPLSTRPVSRSKLPLWQGQWSRPASGWATTGQSRWVHCWS